MRRRCSNTMREVGPRAVGGAGRAGGDIRETEAGAWKDRGERGVRHARQQGATAAALGGRGREGCGLGEGCGTQLPMRHPSTVGTEGWVNTWHRGSVNLGSSAEKRYLWLGSLWAGHTQGRGAAGGLILGTHP